MARLTSKTISSDTNWVAPAGVTSVFILPSDSSRPTLACSVGTLVPVVPDTSYAVVVDSVDILTFGSLYQFFSPASSLVTFDSFTLMWVE